MTMSTASGEGPPVLPRAVLAAVAISVAITLLSLAVAYHPLTRDGGPPRAYLDVYRDANLPTWWSTALLTGAALAHTVAGVAARIASVRGAAAWFACAMLLALFSLAEHTNLHHRLDLVGKQFLGETVWTTDWVPLGTVVGLGVVVAFGLVASWLAGRARWLVLIGSGVLLASALGGEVVVRLLVREGQFSDHLVAYHVAELGENLGAALLLAAALGTLEVTRRQTVLRSRYRTETPQPTSQPTSPPEPQVEPLPVREVVA